MGSEWGSIPKDFAARTTGELPLHGSFFVNFVVSFQFVGAFKFLPTEITLVFLFVAVVFLVPF